MCQTQFVPEKKWFKCTFGYAKSNQYNIFPWKSIHLLALLLTSVFIDISLVMVVKKENKPLEHLRSLTTTSNIIACSSKIIAVFSIAVFWLISKTQIPSISSVQKCQLLFIMTTIFNLYLSEYHKTLKWPFSPQHWNK